jgi:hypothetical protein
VRSRLLVKRPQNSTADRNGRNRESILWLGLGQVQRAASFLPKAAGLEELDALTTLENAALGTDATTGILETAVLGHDWVWLEVLLRRAERVAGRVRCARGFSYLKHLLRPVHGQEKARGLASTGLETAR